MVMKQIFAEITCVNKNFGVVSLIYK